MRKNYHFQSCDGECSVAKEEHSGWSEIIKITVAALLFAMSYVSFVTPVAMPIILAAAVLLSVNDAAYKAFREITNKTISENLLLVTAVIAAFAIGEYREAAVVAILFKTGELLEEYAADRSRHSIKALSDIQTDTVNIRYDGELHTVRTEKVKVGSEIVVLPHERIPLDGVVVSGSSFVDVSALTGESVPLEAVSGSVVLSGAINGDGTLTVRTTQLQKNSTSSRIIAMVEDAAERNGNSQRIITRVAKYYTPIVVIAAVLLMVIPSVITGNWNEWIYKGLVLLVASCPCALVLSVPMSFFTGMGVAAKKGILVKGGLYIETSAAATAVVFDKTGTLTTDKLKVGKVRAYNGFSEKDVLKYACVAEKYSKHPIAAAITEKAHADGIEFGDKDTFKESAGKGTHIFAYGRNILCGSRRLMEESSVNVPNDDDAAVFVSANGLLVGSIVVESKIQPGAVEMIKRLRTMGIKRIAMLTGDSEKQAARIARECGIDEYYSGLLPEGKLRTMEKIKSKTKKVIYVGDGINDAPVLAFADVGIAVGLGTQAAQETADIVLMGGVTKLSDTVEMFRRVMNTVRFNIFFIFAVKLTVITLGAAGYAPIWAAVFADVGVLLITMLVSMGNLLRK